MKQLIFISVLFISCSTTQPTTTPKLVPGVLYDSELKAVVINGDTITKKIVITVLDISQSVYALKSDLITNAKMDSIRDVKIGTLEANVIKLDSSSVILNPKNVTIDSKRMVTFKMDSLMNIRLNSISLRLDRMITKVDSFLVPVKTSIRRK